MTDGSFYSSVRRVFGSKRASSPGFGPRWEPSSVVNAWMGMGTRVLSDPSMPPLQIVLLITILGSLWRTADACDIEHCWGKFRSTQDEYQADSLCMALRVYLDCIHVNKKGCIGNIKYHSVKNGIENQIRQINCTTNGPVYKPVSPVPPVRTDMCSFLGKKVYKHCGLFGDPHLITFTEKFQTCKVEGAWPLVENEHLTVQVTNDPVVEKGVATATGKLTVMIKENMNCVPDRYVMYQAQTDDLPETFEGGFTHYGPERSIELVVVEKGKRVEIHMRHIDTVLLVRQIGRYFTFSISMPEEILNQSKSDAALELCVHGCPGNEQINYKKFLADKKSQITEYVMDNSNQVQIERIDAEELCRAAKVVDFYFDSCVFDLITTGDKNFTVAAYVALQDMLRLTPEAASHQENRTDLNGYDTQYSASAPLRTRNLTSSWLILCSLLLCLLVSKPSLPS